MSLENDRYDDMFTFLVIVGVIIAAVSFVWYALSLFWPYMFFYILPFVVGSLLVGLILRFFTIANSADSSAEIEQTENEVHYIPRFDHKNLLFAYSCLIAGILFTFHSGSTYQVEVDKKGKQTAIFLEWPKVNAKFNKWRTDAYQGSPFKSLKAKGKYQVFYDRRDVAWIAWFCLVLGGPIFFWWLSRDDFVEEKKRMFQVVESRLEQQADQMETRHKWRENVDKKRYEELEMKYQHFDGVLASLREENLALKARVEFSSDKEKLPLKTSEASGILDRDIL
jgi:hypothetical protein